MNRICKLSYRLLACVLPLNLFLQSCSNTFPNTNISTADDILEIPRQSARVDLAKPKFMMEVEVVDTFQERLGSPGVEIKQEPVNVFENGESPQIPVVRKNYLLRRKKYKENGSQRGKEKETRPAVSRIMNCKEGPLDSSSVSKEFLDYLKKQHINLESIDIATIQASAKDLPILFPYGNRIQYLNLVDAKGEDIEPILTQFPNLHTLRLAGCTQLIDQHIEVMLQQGTTLSGLFFEKCPKITDGSALSIAKYGPRLGLSKVGLQDTRVTDMGVVAIASHCAEIKILYLNNTKITDVSLQIIGKYGLKLEQLHLEGCPNITDAGIKSLVSCSASLLDLNLSGTKVIGDGIRHLAIYCPDFYLLNLDLTNCKNIACASVAAIATHCPKIAKLNLQGTLVEDRGFACLLEHCTNITYLNLAHTKITDASIKMLANQRKLRYGLSLNLCNTEVTDAGLLELEGVFDVENLVLPSGKSLRGRQEIDTYLGNLRRGPECPCTCLIQ